MNLDKNQKAFVKTANDNGYTGTITRQGIIDLGDRDWETVKYETTL